MQLRPNRNVGLVIAGLVISGLRHPVPSWRWLIFGCAWSAAVGFVLYMVMPQARSAAGHTPPGGRP